MIFEPDSKKRIRGTIFVLKHLDAPRQVLRARNHWSVDVQYDVAEELDPTGNRMMPYRASPYVGMRLSVDGREEYVSNARVRRESTPRGRVLLCIEEALEQEVYRARQESWEKMLQGEQS